MTQPLPQQGSRNWYAWAQYVHANLGGGGGAVASVNGQTGTVVLEADDIADAGGKVLMTSAERTKLGGVATGATANATDAQLRDRATHTGTQAASTVTGLAAVATSGAYADLTGKPTIPAAYTDEQAQDAAAALLTGGTHTGIAFTYNDASNRVDATVTGGGSADLSGVPTLEELERVALLGTVNATATRRLGPVNLDQRIGGITLAASAAVAASDTNYWTVSLLRLRAGQSPLTIVSRTTKATGGQAFTADQGWAFDDVAWLETARHLRKGDVLALALTKTGTPADLTDLTAAVRYEPGVRPLIRDTFTRTDSTTNLGATDTGQAWTALLGTWGISASQGYAPVTPGGEAYASFPVGASDFTASVQVAATASYYGLLFRVQDAQNFWLLGNDALWKNVGGAFTSIAGLSGWVAGDVLSVTCSGPSIIAYRNGVQVASASDAALQSATGVGLFASSNAARLDDLAVTL